MSRSQFGWFASMVLALAAWLAACGPPFGFRGPVENQLSLVGGVFVFLNLPEDMDPGTLEVTLDGNDVTSSLRLVGASARGTVDVATEGPHTLVASIEVGGAPDTAVRNFETIDLDRPKWCQVLNNSECLLPYPSTYLMVRDPSTATGWRVNLPATGMPTVNGPAVSPQPMNELDGFSPTVQILMHFPAGVDLEASGASRLIPPTPVTPGPPWVDVRTYTGRSLEADSPSILIDADTGERVLHFLELDARAEGNPARQALIMRPAESLQPGHRYIVAIRDLIDPLGSPVEPEAAFEAIRSNRWTSIKGIYAQIFYMYQEVFPVLAAEEGILPEDLILAFDFVVQSDDQLARQMLSMRDQAYLWLEDPLNQNWTVDSVENFDCSAPDAVLARIVSGTFESPLFLDGPITADGVQFMNVDENDVPVQNGVTNPNYTVGIPCTLVDPPPEAEPARPLVLGHGLFGEGSDMVTGIPEMMASVSGAEFNYIAGATDWRGLSNPDLVWVGSHIIGVGSSQLNNFPALPDRLRQGMLNTLVLARMMKEGVFNVDANFQIDGEGVFPGSGEDMYYYGISLGGIMGTFFSALTPDVERFGLDVPGMNFSILMQRSTQFTTFEVILASIGLTDPMQTVLGLGLLHELWVSAEPAGYARHITSDPLPGSGGPKRLLVTPAWLDKQVSNQATEIMARTLGIPNLTASIAQGFQGIPDVDGPVDSAMIMWDAGSFDILEPDHEDYIPPLANVIPSNVCDPHGYRPRIPAAVDQLFAFLTPTGQVVNTCDGLCDAVSPHERPEGVAAEDLCDPLNP